MNFKERLKDYNSFENRYARLKENETNKKARKYFKKQISQKYSEQALSDEQEAILFSQAFERHFMKNPSAAEFGDFEDFEVQKTDNSYIIKGYCDSTNSYGAKMRSNYTLEVCKKDDEWTCVTDVGLRYLKWIIIGIILISLPSIFAYCSYSSVLSSF